MCTHNAGRSALGAALARNRGKGLIRVESAGLAPNMAPNPVTIASLAEIGIDDSGHIPTAVTDDRLRKADIVIAMKPGLNLTLCDHVRYVTWSLPDPGGWDVDSIRTLRDDIDARVQALIDDLPLGQNTN